MGRSSLPSEVQCYPQLPRSISVVDSLSEGPVLSSRNLRLLLREKQLSCFGKICRGFLSNKRQRSVHRNKGYLALMVLLHHDLSKSGTRVPFLESPETLRAIFGCHNFFCISRTEMI